MATIQPDVYEAQCSNIPLNQYQQRLQPDDFSGHCPRCQPNESCDQCSRLQPDESCDECSRLEPDEAQGQCSRSDKPKNQCLNLPPDESENRCLQLYEDHVDKIETVNILPCSHETCNEFPVELIISNNVTHDKLVNLSVSQVTSYVTDNIDIDQSITHSTGTVANLSASQETSYVKDNSEIEQSIAHSTGTVEHVSLSPSNACIRGCDALLEQSVGECSNILDENSGTIDPSEVVHPAYMFKGSDDIQLITGALSEFQTNVGECFTKGCKWAPDGTCILTNSDDNILRIFDLPKELHCQEAWEKGRRLPEMQPALRIPEGGLVYDYCWYPLMSSWDPLSCCLVTSSQDSPTHLWDAYSGELRCTYRAYNCVDEVEHAYSVAFNQCGDRLYCGFKNAVRVFRTDRPGRECETRSLKGVGKPIDMVSCICMNPASQKIYAVSSYFGTVALCAESTGEVVCLLCGSSGTHLTFSPDGTKLYVGARNDPEIFCWDMRNLGTVLYTLQRCVTTNQRVYFDLSPDGQYLMSGNTNGKVTIWNTLEPPDTSNNNPVLPPLLTYQAHNDCTNGISNHKQYPILATSSGQRHFPEVSSNDKNENDESNVTVPTRSSPLLKRQHIQREDSLKLWWLGRL